MFEIHQSEAIVAMEETKHSTHRITKCIQGYPREMIDRGFGKTINHDFDTLHAIDT